MLVLPQVTEVKWHSANKKWYVDKGYEYTKMGQEFMVSVTDLMDGCAILVNLECDNCDKKFERKYHDHVKAVKENGETYCSQCTKNLQGYSYKDVFEFFELFECVLLSESYKNRHQILKFNCSCGRYDEKTLQCFQRGKKCRYCMYDEFAELRKLDYSYVKSLFDVEGYILLESDYRNGKQKLKYICPEGHENSMTVGHFKNGKRCPDCATLRSAELYRHDYEHVYNIFLEKRCELLTKEYINSQTPLKYRCSCGNISFSTLNNFKKISGCNECSSKSKGEILIKDCLNSYKDVVYKTQFSFNDCRNINTLPFDFVIFKESDVVLLIEYDGIQHFEPVEYFGGEENYKYVRQNDSIKNTYCKNNNIPLLRIPYWEFDNVKLILDDVINYIYYGKEPEMCGSFFYLRRCFSVII